MKKRCLPLFALLPLAVLSSCDMLQGLLGGGDEAGDTTPATQWRMTRYDYEYWDNIEGALAPESYIVYHYPSQGNPFYDYRETFDAGSTEPSARYDYTRDATGRTVRRDMYQLTTTPETLLRYTTYTYDSDDDKAVLAKTFDASDVKKSSIEYTYDVGRRITSYQYKSYDSEGTASIGAAYTRSYDVAGVQIDGTYSISIEGTLYTATLSDIAFNGAGQVTLREYELADPQITPVGKEVYTYDEHGNEASYTFYQYDSDEGAVIPMSRDVYTYEEYTPDA